MNESHSELRLLLYSLLLLIPALIAGCSGEFTAVYSNGSSDLNVISLERSLVEKYRFPVSVNDIERITDELHDKVAPDDPAMMELADTITGGLGSSPSGIVVVRAIYSYVQSNWTYVEESENFAQISSAPEIIERGLRGGSLDYSIVMASLLEAAGFRARIVFGCDLNEGICRACP